jgi:2-polyprenyl-3-methyl-5-hydroxy-6-metoxy-1,4-benzoquinol methylase
MQEERIQRFAGQVLSDLASAYGGVMTNLGHRLGLYRALAGAGSLTPEQLAERTGTHERYVREWLHSQRAAGYVTYDPRQDTFELPDEHAFLLADAESPMFMAPAFSAAASMYLDEDKTLDIFKTGQGMPWGDHHHRLFHAVEAFFRNGYRENLASKWIAALDGITERLDSGGRVADVGCGHGASSVLMASAFPAATVFGFDAHAGSIDVARERARQAGVEKQTRFECADARSFPGDGYDLICFMDAYHDMGDPDRAARHARSALAPGGSLMLVEPFACERPEDNVGPVARLYYSASTTLCTPNAVSQGTVALGAQAGPVRLRESLRSAGFEHVRVVHENAFNLVLEAKG